MTECTRCGSQLPQTGLISLQPLYCPHCGAITVKSRKSWQLAWLLVQGYFKDVWTILRHPVLFFKVMPLRGGITRPLAFALVTHWFGTALGFLWNLLMGGALRLYFYRAFSAAEEVIDLPGHENQLSILRDRIFSWLMGVGPVLADPFFTAVSILLTSFFVFIGARILVAPGKAGHPDEISYESAVRIVCFGLTPAILNVIPGLGGFLASIGILIATVIGAREVYHIKTPRALLIALFPKLLFLGIIVMGTLVFIVTLVKFFALMWT